MSSPYVAVKPQNSVTSDMFVVHWSQIRILIPTAQGCEMHLVGNDGKYVLVGETTADVKKKMETATS